MSSRTARRERAAPAQIKRKPRRVSFATGASRRANAQPGPIDLAGLTQHLGYLVRRAQLWIFQDFVRTLADLDIRPAQYSVLTVIDANAGLTQMALANALGIERARLVHLLNGLEKRRLVRRLAATNDRRSHALHLTAEGRKMLAQAKLKASEHEKSLADRVGADNHKQLLSLLSVFASG
jgi:DNA-binding MarR family transcriptional regulator